MEIQTPFLLFGTPLVPYFCELIHILAQAV